MKVKIKLLSIICFIIAIALGIPCVAKAYENESEVPVNYTIKINKIDSASNQNLQGARFSLKDKDGKVIQTQSTDENGILSFGNIKTFGNGTDIYFIDEVRTPKGYVLDEKETIEVDVQKTITNVETGAYKLKISCQTLNYETDITRYDFVPVSTAEQLSKIGSNAEFTYEGKTYRYTPDTNYKLMNDIDLTGINWTPIETPISGIFNGDGHSIKNLKITSITALDYSEVGLFKSFTGIVQGVNLENVYINVPSISGSASSITGKTGIGAFAGYMGGGTIKDCTVSGEIIAGCNNVGGFVGHSAENVIIKLQNCTNNANINSMNNSFNVGGIIGCAACSLSVTDCTNNGNIEGNGSNVGGLVGFVDSDGYEEVAVKAGYTEDGNVVTLVIGNSRTESEYDLYLEDYDLRKLNLLPGGIFTVYDSSLTPIPGFEQVSLTEGKLKIGTVNIKFEGKDTYFIKDVTPVEGYRKIAGYIKVVVTRYWDFESDKFKVSVEQKVISEDEIAKELGDNTNELNSITNTFAPQITFENVGWSNAKATFINCKNNSDIKGKMNVAGILGTAYVKVTIDNCVNTKAVTAEGTGKAAGIVAEIRTEIGEGDAKFADPEQISEIKSSSNSGIITSIGDDAEAAGILAAAFGDVKINNCSNNAKITSPHTTGGIVGYANNNETTISNCSNSNNTLTTTTGDAGGIVGVSDSNSTIILENSVTDTAVDGNGYSMGGIAGYVENLSNLSNNTVSNLTIDSTTERNNGKCGTIAAMVADTNGKNSGNNYTYSNNNVISSSLTSGSSNIGGILGTTNDNISFVNCNLDELTANYTNEIKVAEQDNHMVYFRNMGGLVACSTGMEKKNEMPDSVIVKANNCSMVNSELKSSMKENPMYNMGGLVGFANSLESTNEGENDKLLISNTTIENAIVAGNVGSVVAAQFDVKNRSNSVNVNNVDIENSNICGKLNVGGIAGFAHVQANNVKINDCILSDEIENAPLGSATIGGIVAQADVSFYNRTLAQNINISDTTIKSTNGIAAAVTGCLSGKVDGCIVKDSFITNGSGQQSVGAVVQANVSNDPTFRSISRCTIDNTTITGSGSYNEGFIVGYTTGDISDCKVINGSKFVGLTENAFHSNFGGIVGDTYYEGKIDNCEVNDVTIDNVNNFGGIVATTTKSVTNCKVKNINVTNFKGKAGGIASSIYSNIVQVEKNTAENVNIKTDVMSAFAGGITCYVYDGTVKDNVVTDINLELTGQNSEVGGLITSISSSTDFSNNKVQGAKICGTFRAGGISATVGGDIKNAENNIVKDYVKDGVSKKSEIIINSEDTRSMAGGLFGLLNGYSTIKNCKFENSIVQSTGHAGGIVGLSNMPLEGNIVNNAKVTSKNENAGQYEPYAGGIAGLTTCPIKDCDAVATTVESNAYYTGGIAGFSGGTIADCNVENNCKIKSEYNKPNMYFAAIGGIAGQTASDISNCSSTGTTIEGAGFVGGITGLSTGNVSGNTSTNDSITNTCVETSPNNYTMPKTGGIIGFANRTLSNNTVSGTTINSEGRVGGIVGFAFNNTSENSVVNCTINNTADISKLSPGDRNNMPTTGGIAGFANCNVNNNTVSGTTINGAGDVGGIMGIVPDSYNRQISGNVVNSNTNINNKKGSNLMLHTGGIAGIIAPPMSGAPQIVFNNNDISNSSITSSNNYTGGIAGFAASTIADSDVTETTITQMSGSGLGGIAGFGTQYFSDLNPYTIINDCTLTDVTLDGSNVVDDVCPIRPLSHSNVIVDGEEYVSQVEEAAMLTSEEELETTSNSIDEEVIEPASNGTNVANSIQSSTSSKTNSEEDNGKVVEDIPETEEKNEENKDNKDNEDADIKTNSEENTTGNVSDGTETGNAGETEDNQDKVDDSTKTQTNTEKTDMEKSESEQTTSSEDKESLNTESGVSETK